MGKHLGQALKEARVDAGYSQWDLAKPLGYTSPQYISNIERGIANVNLETLMKICRILRTRRSKFIAAFKEDYLEEMHGKLKELRFIK